MRFVGVIQAYNEEGRIGAAVTSLFKAGCDSVSVLDGAWLRPDGLPFDGTNLASTDRTRDEAHEAGAHVRVGNGFPSDAAKQTALVNGCGAKRGDYVIKIDADETLEGDLYSPGSHALIMLQNEGPNDIPGVRSTWPRGDDSPVAIPLLRMLMWTAGLACSRPGRWSSEEGPVEPYLVGALSARVKQGRHDPLLRQAYQLLRDHEHLLPPVEMAALPVLDGVLIRHRRHDGKAAQKRAYYAEAAA